MQIVLLWACVSYVQVLEHKDTLAAISNEAVQMAALEELLAQVTEK
jgi:hypothetical protein